MSHAMRHVKAIIIPRPTFRTAYRACVSALVRPIAAVATRVPRERRNGECSSRDRDPISASFSVNG